MVNFNDVNANQLVEALSEEMKNVSGIEAPEWSKFVKTGPQAERMPDNPDWWYLRTASVLRKIAILGPVGVSKLRVKYGGRKNRGVRPERFVRASGKIIRVILQQLEKAQLIKKVEKGVHKGRIITPKGMSLLDKTSIRLIKSRPRVKETVEVKKEVVKKEEAKQVVKKEQQPIVKKEEIKQSVVKTEEPVQN